jgi:hypothetical protein
MRTVCEEYCDLNENCLWRILWSYWELSVKNIVILLRTVCEEYCDLIENCLWRILWSCWELSVKNIVILMITAYCVSNNVIFLLVMIEYLFRYIIYLFISSSFICVPKIFSCRHNFPLPMNFKVGLSVCIVLWREIFHQWQMEKGFFILSNLKGIDFGSVVLPYESPPLKFVFYFPFFF